MGSLLDAFMCGLHGVYPAGWVSVPRIMAISRTVKTAIGRRRQLFSPSPDRNGSKTRNAITTTGPMKRAGVSIEGGKDDSKPYSHKKKQSGFRAGWRIV